MRRRVRRGRTRGVGGRVLVAEIVAVVMVASAFAPRWVFIGVFLLAAAVLVATFGRAGGRWWSDVVVLSRRLRRRRRLAAAQVLAAAVGEGSVPPAVAWLRTLAPTLTLRSVTLGTQTAAVGADEDGWFAVAEIGALWGEDPGLVAADPAARWPQSPWAAGALRLRSGSPTVPYRDLGALLDLVSVVQVVLAAGPTPDRARPAWVAVRITPADALATERAEGVSAIERAVVVAAAKAVRVLETAGWPARLVPPDALVPVLGAAIGLDGPPQEQWSWWRAGRTVRTHYAVHGWTPDHGTLAAGVAQLAVHLRRTGADEDDDPLEQAAVIAAVTAAPAALRVTAQAVLRAAAAQGVRLRPLDGEQAPAVWSTAPTAAAL